MDKPVKEFVFKLKTNILKPGDTVEADLSLKCFKNVDVKCLQVEIHGTERYESSVPKQPQT
jgi:hypothetical protein